MKQQDAEHEAPIEPDFPIIDTHTHLFTASGGGWNSYPDRALAEDRAASGHNVRATVYVDCQTGYLTDGPEEMRVIGETRTVESQIRDAARSGDKSLTGISAAIVSHVNMMLGGRAEDVLRAHMRESKRFRGIRHVAHWQEGKKDYHGMATTKEMLRQPAFIDGVACIGRLGLVFDARVDFTQLSDVAYLARALPEATIVLNHTGTPFGLGREAARNGYETWYSGMKEVATCPNVSVKIGALFMRWNDDQGSTSKSSEDAARDVEHYVKGTIDLFSPQRCMFESNFPIDRQCISYGNLWNTFKRITKDFSRSEKEAMFFGTAARAYKIEV